MTSYFIERMSYKLHKLTLNYINYNANKLRKKPLYVVCRLYVLTFPSSSRVVVAALYPVVFPLMLCFSLSAVESILNVLGLPSSPYCEEDKKNH